VECLFQLYNSGETAADVTLLFTWAVSTLIFLTSALMLLCCFSWFLCLFHLQMSAKDVSQDPLKQSDN
jgi:TRAP-type mannitol/chloroaromatic compound transport system permease small subunit